MRRTESPGPAAPCASPLGLLNVSPSPTTAPPPAPAPSGAPAGAPPGPAHPPPRGSGGGGAPPAPLSLVLSGHAASLAAY